MAGYYFNRAAEGVHDDLYAKALVFELNGTEVALVVCDLSGVPREIVEKAREKIQETTGIPRNHVMISATHTHTGPVILQNNTRYNLTSEMLEIAIKYAEDLPELIANSVKTARSTMAPSTVSAVIGREGSLTFNRRFHMKDGSIGWNPGKLNPDIIRPAGPIDPEVPVVFFASQRNEARATYVNYALHLDSPLSRNDHFYRADS